MSTARDTVVSTPELLALILAQLPMRDLLLTAPLISKTWHEVTLSPTVQRALFFQPDPSPSAPITNPLLMEVFPPFFAPEGTNRWAWPGTASSIASMPWAKAPEAFKRADASWRRMLLVQPPAQKMIVVETCHGQMGDSESRTVLHDGPLRMGQLYDLAVPFVAQIASSFCVRWHTEVDREADVTLARIYTMQCTSTPPMLGRQFISDGAPESVKNGWWSDEDDYDSE
ncbi:hypothetical protein B0H17DRAFT_1060892 [Mycena rosella]|uniref:F-box domain-containing protein n=1 Tax=Mycena rosella TaxID=1033263 RepID=A0AAD7DM87_MYCRO|nr:hypothetical protein B0H17DRAFT_1060892 [Mycena rosella]